MLRAMQDALQAHAAAHPGEPFDHERHMPACMRKARDDPVTWAGGGGGFDEEARHYTQDVRVAALKRLWERAPPSPGRYLYRHAFYVRIASREPAAWALCGTHEERATALKDPKSLNRGSRPPRAIVEAWDSALAAAFGGLKFHNQRALSGDKPQGVWTTELQTK